MSETLQTFMAGYGFKSAVVPISHLKDLILINNNHHTRIQVFLPGLLIII